MTAHDQLIIQYREAMKHFKGDDEIMRYYCKLANEWQKGMLIEWMRRNK